MLLFASALKNPLQALVPDAAVWIREDRVHWAGPAKELPSAAKTDREQIHLPETLLTPGMINAHAHLELSHLEGFPYPGTFTKWIRAILAARTNSEERNCDAGLERGIRRSILGGTTTVGDHIGVTGDVQALLKSSLRGIAFLEVIGVVPEVAADILRMAQLLEAQYSTHSSRWRIIPSPHSVHALHPEILRELLAQPFPLYSIHLAESREEMEYFSDNKGELHDLIAERGSVLKRESNSSIRELLASQRLDQRILVIHGNYLDDEEIAWLAKAGCSVVHCPLSHHYFEHQKFRMEKFIAEKVNLAFGTDSLASARSLSMFDVLRSAEMEFPWSTREQLFGMATLGGAKALGMDAEIGLIAPGKKADIIGVPFLKANNELESIFQAEVVRISIIDGISVLNHQAPISDTGLPN